MTHSTKSKAKPKARFTFEAIGTHWVIDLFAPAHKLHPISKLIADRIELFDKTYSRFRPDSWVTKISQELGEHKVPADFDKLYKLYQQMYQLTDGLVTPLIGDVMERAGYDANYSLRPGKLRRPPKLNEALEYHHDTLHVKYRCVLDFGAAGKGYLVDILGELLEKQGIQNFVIDAGGDILDRSPSPTPVGLESPIDSQKVIGVVNLSNNSLCGSAGNRRKWGKYHHIINPKTLQSVENIRAVWVVADSTLLADGLSTCLFFVPPEVLKEQFDFEYVVLKDNNSISVSSSFPGKVFLA